MTRPLLAALAAVALSACDAGAPAGGEGEPAGGAPVAFELPEGARSSEPTDMAVLFGIVGRFDAPVQISRSRHGLQGVPEWLSLDGPFPYPGSNLHELLAEPVVRGLLAQQPRLEEAFDAAPQVVVVQGATRSASPAEQLREAVALVQAVSESGAAAIVDLQSWTFHSPDAWREGVFAADAPPSERLVRTVVRDEEPGPGHRVHTRGMRSFGRPDVSVRGVPQGRVPDAVALVERFVALQGAGEVVPEGAPVRIAGVADAMRVRHGGSLEDPELRNTHFELRWPR